LFSSYFRSSGVTYLTTNSLFDKPRLLQVKGVPVKRIKEVSLSSAYFTSQTVVFILDAVDTIYIYFGLTVKKSDKRMGIDAANKIKDEVRGGKANIIFIYDDPTNEKFWAHFKDVRISIIIPI
jgi:hypothetical protein